MVKIYGKAFNTKNKSMSVPMSVCTYVEIKLEIGPKQFFNLDAEK